MKDLLAVGDVFELKPGMQVYYEVPEHFVYDNRLGVMDKVAVKDIEVGEVLFRGMYTDFLVGNYVVTLVQSKGGGTGHGPHDVYPDGWHVTAQKMTEDEDDYIIVHFYQSGCFTAMIRPEELELKGKAKLTYVRED